MRIGFTGTQKGMSECQKKGLSRFLKENGCEEFHHGDCIGADSDAHDVVREWEAQERRVGLKGVTVYIHPPSNPAKRRWCVGGFLCPEKPYLERNHDIVDACDVLIAAPEGEEVLRSGTWATVRYARKTGKRVVILAREP